MEMIYLYSRRQKLNQNAVLQNGVLQSKDFLKMKYTPQRTIQTRWYLVQVDLDIKSQLNLNIKYQGIYYWIFLAKNPDNQGKSGKFSRWWPEWYTYKDNKDSQEIVYNQ